MLSMAKPLACLAILSTALQAQSTDDCKQRSVIVNALDKHGIPIKRLTAGNFRASYRSQRLNILSLDQTEDPYRRVVVLLDTSGSMSGALEGDSNKWKIAQAAASEFLSLSPLQTKVSFMTFAANIQRRFEASEGRQVIEDWLRSKPVSEAKNVKGRTALYEAILDGLKSLEPAQPGDSVYVITDGGENASRDKESRIERALQASGVRLFAFLVDGPARTEGEIIGPSDLLNLTRSSGGFLVSTNPDSFSPDRTLNRTARFRYDDKVVDGIRSYTRLVQAEMNSFYILTVQPPEASSKPESWKLEVVDAQGRSRKDVAVVYPHQLTGCTLQSLRR